MLKSARNAIQTSFKIYNRSSLFPVISLQIVEIVKNSMKILIEHLFLF